MIERTSIQYVFHNVAKLQVLTIPDIDCDTKLKGENVISFIIDLGNQNCGQI